MTNDKLSFIQEAVLLQLPYGIENPIRTKDVAERTGLSIRETRAVINSLIMDHNIPIGGGRSEGKHGFYIVTNEDELIKATVPLKNQITNMKQRVDQLEKIDVTKKVVKQKLYGV